MRSEFVKNCFPCISTEGSFQMLFISLKLIDALLFLSNLAVNYSKKQTVTSPYSSMSSVVMAAYLNIVFFTFILEFHQDMKLIIYVLSRECTVFNWFQRFFICVRFFTKAFFIRIHLVVYQPSFR